MRGANFRLPPARLSSDRMKATLFLNGFEWPSNSKVTVTLDGSNLSDFLDRTLDLDGDGEAGGVANWSFSTLSVEASDPSTVVRGQVFDSDNSEGDKPLEGVIISVVGNEDQWTVTTDANEKFRLSSAPVGRFFVVVDGPWWDPNPAETIQDDSWKDRDYYTFVGKAWEAVPGKEVNATKYGSYEEDGSYVSDPRDGKIYLPLVKKGALQTINPGAETDLPLRRVTSTRPPPNRLRCFGPLPSPSRPVPCNPMMGLPEAAWGLPPWIPSACRNLSPNPWRCP